MCGFATGCAAAVHSSGRARHVGLSPKCSVPPLRDPGSPAEPPRPLCQCTSSDVLETSPAVVPVECAPCAVGQTVPGGAMLGLGVGGAPGVVGQPPHVCAPPPNAAGLACCDTPTLFGEVTSKEWLHRSTAAVCDTLGISSTKRLHDTTTGPVPGCNKPVKQQKDMFSAPPATFHGGP